MAQSVETESLIKQLAGEAGGRQHPDIIPFGWAFLMAAALSLAIAVAIVFAWIGFRPDLLRHPVPFFYKVASALALAGGGFFLARRAARPGDRGVALVALLPGAALLVFRAVTDRAGLPVMGGSDVSAFGCVGAILVVSVPALLITLAALRIGAPTRPGLAGATAGLVSGALGAAAYALACQNDAGLFLAIWYTTAILIVAAFGAAIGRYALAW